jgi:3-phenylpropionate/trans-cinnamate dioxygenase ferredoxin subunit
MLNTLFNADTPQRTDGFIPVASKADLAQGKLQRVNANGQSVVLTVLEREDGQAEAQVVAFSSICPHAMGDLAQGWLTADEIDCPMHYYRYSLRSGECNFPKGGPKLRKYAVTVESGVVYVKVDPPKWMERSQE